MQFAILNLQYICYNDLTQLQKKKNSIASNKNRSKSHEKFFLFIVYYNTISRDEFSVFSYENVSFSSRGSFCLVRGQPQVSAEADAKRAESTSEFLI